MRTYSNKRPKPEPPTLEQVTTLFKNEGKPALEAKIFYYHYAATGWHLGYTPVNNWRALALGWIAREVKKVEAKDPTAPANFFRVQTQEELREIELIKQGYARLKKDILPTDLSGVEGAGPD